MLHDSRCRGHAEIQVTGYYRPPTYLAYAAYLAYQVTRNFGAVAHIAGNTGRTTCSVHIIRFEFLVPNTLYKPIDALYRHFRTRCR